MHDYDSTEIKKMLLLDIEGVCKHLFPEGCVKNNRFCIGDVDGKKGESLKVHLSGSKKGLFIDFAENENKGDVFSLWQAARKCTFVETLTQAKKYLGVKEDLPRIEKIQAFVSNDSVPLQHQDICFQYCKSRGINKKTLKKYNVKSVKKYSKFNNTFLLFEFPKKKGTRPVYIKCLGINKTDSGKHDIMSTSPVYYTLLGWPTVDDNARDIIITEGEFDMLAMSMMVEASGLDIPVLSIPSGVSAGGWITNDYKDLMQFERIFLCFDADTPGEDGAKKVASRLGLHRCFRILPPKNIKDANKALQELSGEDKDINGWIGKAYTFNPPGLASASAYYTDMCNYLNKKQNEKNTFVLPLCEIYLREQECSLLSGFPGHGKSEFAYQLICHEMLTNNNPCCFVSLEIPSAIVVAKIMNQYFGKQNTTNDERKYFNKMAKDKLFIVDKSKQPEYTKDIKLLREDLMYASKRYGTKLSFVDSLHYLAGKKDYQRQNDVVMLLKDTAVDSYSHTMIICHALLSGDHKANRVPGLGETEGSNGIAVPIDWGLSIWKRPEPEEGSSNQRFSDGKLAVWKDKEGGNCKAYDLWFDKDSKRFRTTRENIDQMLQKLEQDTHNNKYGY